MNGLAGILGSRIRLSSHLVMPITAGLICLILLVKAIASTVDVRSGDELLDYLVTWLPILAANAAYLISVLWASRFKVHSAPVYAGNCKNVLNWALLIVTTVLALGWFYILFNLVVNFYVGEIFASLYVYWAFIIVYASWLVASGVQRRFAWMDFIVQASALLTVLWGLVDSVYRLM